MNGSIRLARESDAAALADIYAPVVRDTTISFEMTPPDAAEMAARIAKTLAMFPWLVWDEGGRAVGYAYASKHREREAYQWSVDVSCYVHPDFRGRGLGRALYGRLFPVLEAQGFQTAFAGIALPNAASVALHESMGFTPIGIYKEVGWKLGAWRDTGWWQRRIGHAVPDPLPPRPLGSLGPGVLERS